MEALHSWWFYFIYTGGYFSYIHIFLSFLIKFQIPVVCYFAFVKINLHYLIWLYVIIVNIERCNIMELDLYYFYDTYHSLISQNFKKKCIKVNVITCYWSSKRFHKQKDSEIGAKYIRVPTVSWVKTASYYLKYSILLYKIHVVIFSTLCFISLF